MKSAVVCTLLALATVCGRATLAAEPKVATLDLKKVYDNYAPFQQEYGALKKEVEDAAADIKARKADIELNNARFAELTRNDPAYTELEAKIAQDKAQLDASISLHKAGFERKEARIYAVAYAAIFKQLDTYCQENGIDVVVRPNRGLVQDPDEADSKVVAAQLNQKILYTRPRLDITDDFLMFLNRRPDCERCKEKSGAK
jgi:Skp family chaperone for outer membrane proteins